MNAKKCDRCGSYYAEMPYYSVDVKKGFFSTSDTFSVDICQCCAEDLEKWLNSYKPKKFKIVSKGGKNNERNQG